MIKVVIKLDNKFYKLVIKIYHNNSDSKTRLYQKDIYYYNRKFIINRPFNNSYKILPIKLFLF